MAAKRPPTAKDVRKLLAFLPMLYAEGFAPIKRVNSRYSDGSVVAFPWPDYDETVSRFVDAVRRDCWLDPEYVPEEAGKLMTSETAIRKATVPEIQMGLISNS